MKVSDIPRVKAGGSAQSTGVEYDHDSARSILAHEASDLLGYNVLAAEVTGNIGAMVKPGELALALLSADIETLDAASVLRYQVGAVASRLGERTSELLRSGRLKTWTERWGMSMPAWQSTAIGDYRQPIPEFVISKAVQIKKACPGVSFVIQHLGEDAPDPFLVAVFGNEVYYVEVWEEPKFEGRATL